MNRYTNDSEYLHLRLARFLERNGPIPEEKLLEASGPGEYEYYERINLEREATRSQVLEWAKTIVWPDPNSENPLGMYWRAAKEIDITCPHTMGHVLHDEYNAVSGLFFRGGKLEYYGFAWQSRPSNFLAMGVRTIFRDMLESFEPSYEIKMAAGALALFFWADRCQVEERPLPKEQSSDHWDRSPMPSVNSAPVQANSRNPNSKNRKRRKTFKIKNMDQKHV